MGAAVIACGGASPVLELGEHVLDLVALAVERFVIFQRLRAVFGGRDTGMVPRFARLLRNQLLS
jgi:hypothetical protein